jgi:hypothetical protein
MRSSGGGGRIVSRALALVSRPGSKLALLLLLLSAGEYAQDALDLLHSAAGISEA